MIIILWTMYKLQFSSEHPKVSFLLKAQVKLLCYQSRMASIHLSLLAFVDILFYYLSMASN